MRATGLESPATGPPADARRRYSFTAAAPLSPSARERLPTGKLPGGAISVLPRRPAGAAGEEARLLLKREGRGRLRAPLTPPRPAPQALLEQPPQRHDRGRVA